MILTFRYEVIALHSVLSTQDQAAAFRLPPPGVRKVNAGHAYVWSVDTSESELVLNSWVTSSLLQLSIVKVNVILNLMRLGLESGSVVQRIWAQLGPEHRTGSSHLPVTPAPGDPSKPPAFLGMFTSIVCTQTYTQLLIPGCSSQTLVCGNIWCPLIRVLSEEILDKESQIWIFPQKKLLKTV